MLFSCANSNNKKASGSSSPAGAQPARVKTYKLNVVAEYPHDVEAYTQGLFFHDGVMYESTGQYGESSMRTVELKTGRPVRLKKVGKQYFVEGSVVFGDDLYVLTWMEKTVFVYDSKTLELKSQKSYPREGWGLTTDGEYLIASDGSSNIYFLDKELNLKRYIQAKLGTRPIKFLNELEYIDGKIWANVYTSDEIVIINPKTGYVEGIIDCNGLLPQDLRTYDTDVLNGIAYNPQTGKIYLTGKNWPKLYEIRLVPTN
jgi:glutaminyl-peptide cyclotransferase